MRSRIENALLVLAAAILLLVCLGQYGAMALHQRQLRQQLELQREQGDRPLQPLAEQEHKAFLIPLPELPPGPAINCKRGGAALL